MRWRWMTVPARRENSLTTTGLLRIVNDLSFERVTLLHAAIFEHWLHNLYGVILQVEINLTFSNPVSFLSALCNSFLEICIKAKNLKQQKDILIISAQLATFFGKLVNCDLVIFFKPACQTLPRRGPCCLLLWETVSI